MHVRESQTVVGRINQVCLHGLVCLPLLVGVSAPALAAPILGQNQEQSLSDPPTAPLIRPTELSARATVIQFSVLPSPANPDRFETTIFVQQDGGRRICVNHTSPVIIVRSYRSDADQFVPDIPSQIEGQDSGDVGELAGFNSNKVFIRPQDADDLFDLPDEPFSVGRFEGVFRRDEADCDQELTEGDFACLDDVIRTHDCDLTQHANLMRDLRITLALNSIPIIAPAAGESFTGLDGQDFGADVITRPSSFTAAAPLFSGSFSGGGGDGLLLVPDLIGLKLSSAKSLIVSTGFILGVVTVKSDSSANLLQSIIVSTAHAQSEPPGEPAGNVISQAPEGGTREPPGTAVSLTVKTSNGGSGTTPVPEPSSSSIFILGLILVAGSYWFLRRRTQLPPTRT